MVFCSDCDLTDNLYINFSSLNLYEPQYATLVIVKDYILLYPPA
jgi:hypothetical protein